MAWYNKYRPQKFSDVIGQNLVKSVLQNALEKDRIKHAYLFYGPKGVGKTTLARIFANSLNDLEKIPEAKIDLIEMDAASNTSIDDVRQLIESAKTPPLSGKYKIYIIDEVHMLSKPAMNALLKILEEPPIYLIFLLATTNPEKLIPTVLSRLTKLNLNSHSTDDIVQTLKRVTTGENVKIDEDSLKLIAKRSGGSLRDAINMLETIASYELDNYDLAKTTDLLGLLPEELLTNIAITLTNGELVSTESISKLESTGIDGETFLGQFLDFLLTRSFEGIRDFDSIILPIAAILDLKLPITSITSSIALVQVKINESEVTVKTVKKNPELVTKISKPIEMQTPKVETVSVEPTVPADKPEIKPEAVRETELTQPLQTESYEVIEEVIATAVETNKMSDTISNNNSSINANDVLDFFRSQNAANDTPPILKMMTNDLTVENITDSSIQIGVSNSIFLAQLNSPKLNQWISEKFSARFGSNYKLESKVRDSNKPAPQPPITRANNIAENKANYEPRPTQYSQPAKPKPPVKKDLDPGIFYEVYNALPPNADPEKLKVFHGPIPKPNHSENWDDHADELFDFE